MKKLFVVFLLSLYFTPSFTQKEEIHFNQLTTSDGLSQNTIDHILQDKYGQMWFSTLVGVDKYDGQSFTNRVFKKALTEEITSIFEWCKEDKVIVGTTKGLYSIETLTNKIDTLSEDYKEVVKIFYNKDSTAFFLFTRKEIINYQSGKKYQVDGLIVDVARVSGDYFILASGKGIYYFYPEQKNYIGDSIFLDRKISVLHLDSAKNILYVGTQKLGIYSYEIGKLSPLLEYKIPTYGINLSPSPVSAILERENFLWVGTENSGLYLFRPGKTSKPIVCLAEGNYQPKVDISKNKIRAIYASKDSVIWVGTRAGGINIRQDQKQSFRHHFRGEYTSSDNTTIQEVKIDSLSTYDNETWGIYQLDEKTVWLATDQNGVAVVDLENNFVIAQKALPMGAEIELPPALLPKAKTVYCFRALGERIYMGTEAGIFQTKRHWRYYHPTRFLGPSISILEYDSLENRWWAGKRGGSEIYILERKFTAHDTIQFGDEETLSFIHKSVDSCIWVGTTKGLRRYRYQNENWEENKHILEGEHITCLWQSKGGGYLWLGTDSKGVYHYNLSQDRVVQHFNADNSDFPKDEIIYAIIGDRFDCVWFSTNHGVGRLNPKDTIFNFYSVNDGLQSDEFNAGAVFANEKKPFFFFGGVNGINSFRPITMISDRALPELSLLRYAYPSTEAKTESGRVEGLLKGGENSIWLPNQFKYVEITPILFDYHDLSNNQFRYKLNNGVYRYLKDGKFTFTENEIKRFLWNTNELQLEYRSSHSDWQVHPPIHIVRDWFSWVYLFWLVTIIGTFLLVRTLWINSRENERLNKIQGKINDIARLEKTHDLCDLALAHFIDNKIFGFHYVIISFVNFYKKEIGVKRVNFKDGKRIPYSKEWNEMSNYPLEGDKDILVQVANSKRTVKVVRKKVYDKEMTFGALNEQIFKQFKHHRLARLFVPITHRATLSANLHEDDLEQAKEGSLANEQGDIVMGVVEAGYRLNIFEMAIIWLKNKFGLSLKLRKERWLEKNEVRLKLYTDNFAQPYYRALLKEERKRLYGEIIEDSEQNAENHHVFIRDVLFKLAKLFNVDYANVAFRTFNSKEINILDRGIYYNFKPEDVVRGQIDHRRFNKDKIGIVRHVTEEKEPYFTGDVSKDTYYQRFFEPIQSEIGIPMLNEYDEVVGVFILSSKQKEYFNKLHVQVLKKVIHKTTEYFTIIKRYNALQKSTIPFDVFSKKQLTIYKAAAASLDEYFDSDHISIWEREPSNELSYKLTYTTKKEFSASYKSLGFTRAKINERIQDNDQNLIIRIQQKEQFAKTTRIYQLCNQEGFESMVAVIVVAEGNYEALINIFSKRKLPNKFNRYSRKFLEQIAKKTGLAVQGINLIQAIEKISKSLSQGTTKRTLQVLVDDARTFLKADLVALFPYKEKRRDILLKEGYFAGNFPKHHKQRLEKRANIANYIIKKGTQWIENRGDYEKVFFETLRLEKEEKPFEDSFWHMNSIKSVAAIRLDYNKEPLGVMFINYLAPKDFSQEETKRFINAFTNLSTTALLNEDYISTIKEETQKLNQEKRALIEEKKDVIKEKEAIKFEYDLVYEKMEQMLPRSTKASYYLILQGINHDIRNFLLKLQAGLLNITNKESLKVKLGKDNSKFLDSSLVDLDLNIRSTTNLLNLFEVQKTATKKAIDVKQVLNQVIFFFENREKSICFEREIEKDIKPLFCVKTEFSMIIYNLLNNAVQAIKTKNKNQAFKAKITIQAHFQDNQYHIKIKDNGIGIDIALKEKLFEFGITTREKGIGIGLYFVRETIEKNFLGRIKLKSEKGKGANFHIVIPNRINQLKD